MNYKVLLIAVLSISISTIYAQAPESVQVIGHPFTESICSNTQNAGTINIISAFPGNSGSSINLSDTTFLCFGDSALVEHNNDQILSGDPNPATTPEVGYAFYSCPPNVIGDELSSIQADPCIINDPPTPNGLYIARSVAPNNPDLILSNDGSINSLFNNGDPSLIYLAPITFDAYSGSPVFENNGSCVNVSVNEAFAVVYLNQLRASSITSAGLNGSFVLEGGLPEYKTNDTYSVTSIVKSVSPGVNGTVTGGSLQHGDRVNISVPEAGTYTITIEDNVGCPLSFEMTFNNDAVIFEIGSLDVELGDNFCIPINVRNFDSVTFTSFVLTFNPNVIDYQSFQNWSLTSTGFNINENDADRGLLRLVWLSDDINNGESLPDGSLLIEFCFTTAPGAQIGDMTGLNLIESGSTNLEVLAGQNSDEREVGVSPGKVTITTTDLAATANSCGSLPGRMDGELTVFAFAGQPPYNVAITGPASRSDMINTEGGQLIFTGLPPGIYSVMIIDDTGASFNFNKEVYDGGPKAQPRPNFSLNATPPSCFDASDGSIVLDTSSGHIVQPYSIEWSTEQYNTDVITGLERGTYVVTVTDAFGCEEVENETLSQTKVTISANVTDASCSGYSDGSAVIDASGGTPMSGDSYRYIWDDGNEQSTGTTATLMNLSDGWHYVTVVDDNNCDFVDSFFVSASRRIVLNSLTVTEPLCYGEASGSISLVAGTEGGTANRPYSIFIFNESNMQVGSPMGPDGAIATNLPQGDYQILIEDNTMPNACVLDTQITLQQPDSMRIRVNKTDVTCNGNGMDGTITLTVSGGTPDASGDYDFNWSGGLANSNSHSSLDSGNYTVTVVDNNGCMKTENITINPPRPPRLVSVTSTLPTCPETCDGTITITAAPNPSFPIQSYRVNRPGETLDTTTNSNVVTIRGFCGGDFYSVTRIVDEAGCVAMPGTFDVFPDRDSLSLDTPLLRLEDPTCAGRSDGRIILALQGANPPYIVEWEGEAPDTLNTSVDTFNNLSAGIYNVMVNDINNCGNLSFSFTLSEPPPLSVDLSNQTPTSCFNSCDAAITAEAIGGNPMGGNYDFEWSSGFTETGVGTSTATDLCAGQQWVAITDGSCLDTFMFNIDAPDSIIIDLVDLTEPSCFGSSDGRLEVSASGGNGNYQYNWENGPNSAEYNGLSSGLYVVIVEDAEMCLATDTFELEDPDSLNAFFMASDIVDPSCPGEEDGMLTVSVNGGNGGIEYSWSNLPSTEPEVSSLGAGTYVVTVEDVNGCSDTAQATLITAPPISLNLPIPDTPACRGGIISYQLTTSDVSGGNGGPYQYSIGNSGLVAVGTEVTAMAGNVILTVIDNNGCAFDTLLTIPTREGIQIDLQEEIEIRLGDSLSLSPIVTSAAPIVSYSWAPANGLSCTDCPNPIASPGNSTTYTFMVTDENGCTASANIRVLINSRREVYIPNTFTPNADGINDEFRIYTGRGVNEIISFQVFDRWGTLIWEGRNLFPSENGSAGWDGTMNGKVLKPGVFTYFAEISFLDQRVILYKGDITLISPRE